jgi:O-antigen/teichoic acid export membrane protein
MAEVTHPVYIATSTAYNPRERQEAGIAALVSLAGVQASTICDPHILKLTGTYAMGERWRTRLTRLRADHLVRNSLFLVLSSGLQAGLGFLFWIITTRIFSATDVGIASSLISATTLIAYLALLGLNSGLVRFLPTAPDRNALITATLLLVAAGGAVLGLLYALLTPVIAPSLAFVGQRPILVIGFAVLTAAGAINLITDSIFIASRKTGYNAIVDGGIGGLAKLVCAMLLVGTSAYGLFCASAAGFVLAGAASIIIMMIALRWRPSLKKPIRTLRPLLRFSGASYAGNVLNMIPSLAVPLIILDRLGASAAGYYFVAFQLATLLYSAAYAVEQAFLAEGSHPDADWKKLLSRSRRVLLTFCLPACLILVVSGRWLLLLFGAAYSLHGTAALILLAIAAIPIAVNNWLMTVLRLSGRLRMIVVSSAVYAVSICGLAWFLAPNGLTALAGAWPIGALLGAAVAAIPHNPPGRHKRCKRAQSTRHRKTRLEMAAHASDGR